MLIGAFHYLKTTVATDDYPAYGVDDTILYCAAFRIPLRDTTTITDYMVQRPTFGSAIPFKNTHAYPFPCQTSMHVETSSRSESEAAAA